MGGKLDVAMTANQLKIHIFVRKSATLVVEHQIYLSEAQFVVELLVVALDHADAHIGIFCDKIRKRGMKFVAAVALKIADVENGAVLVGYADGFSSNPLKLRGKHNGFVVEMLTCGGERELAVFALKELDAYFLFKRLYLLRNCRLRDITSLSRLGEAALFHYRLKVFYLSEKHKKPPYNL